ncbi:MAG: glyceraldehyde 3-phosphate dehydrogenase NAD-binding domain-containing protein [Patescibacteria group bacterium]
MDTKNLRVAINGFGRIGRLFFRQIFDKVDVIAINDLSDAKNLAYLLKYDTVYRTWNKDVDAILKNVKFLQEKDPAKLPWKDLNIDVVIEATGIFESFEKNRAHLQAGAKRVIISAPAKDDEQADAQTILLGVNDDQLKNCKIVATGSCTTNAAHPIAQILLESVGVKKAVLNTIHAYTGTQSIVDSISSKDFRRGRAAAMNIIPATSGVTVSVVRAVKELVGKFDGLAMRVPVATGSIVDFTFISGRPTSVEEINSIFKKAAQDPRWKNILTVVEDPIVSSDVIGMPYSAVVDLSFTKVVDGDLVKIFSWYDNEAGYVNTLVRHVEKIAATL